MIDSTWVAAALVPPTPTLLAGYPALGYQAVKSRYAPWVFSCAGGIGCVGTIAVLLGDVSDHRVLLAAWVPLFQLCLYGQRMGPDVCLSIPDN